MNRLFFFFIPFLIMSCSHETLQDGKYATITKSFVYGLAVNKTENEVRLFLLEELSTNYSHEELQVQQDWSNYRIGTLQRQNEFNWSLLGVDTDIEYYDKPERLNLSIGPLILTAAITRLFGPRTGADIEATPASLSPTLCAHPRLRTAARAAALNLAPVNPRCNFSASSQARSI